MRTYKKDDFDYSKVAGVVVDMKPVDVRPGPVKAAGRRRSSIVSKPPDIECTSCQEIISFAPHIHCTECKRAEVFLCLACFQLGAEIGEHVRGHNYEVAHRCGPPVFKPAPHEGHNWGALEDQRLLSLIRTYKLDDWPKIAYSEFGRARSVEEALNHFSTCFMRSVIGEIAVEEIVYPPIHAFGFTEPELYTGEFFKPTPADELMHQIKELCEQIPDGRRLLYEVNYAESPAIRPSRVADDLLNDHLEEMICEFSHVHVEHNPAVLAELMYGRPKCFLVNRFTHLCKSPRQNSDKATPENMRALYLEHLNQTPRSRRFSFQPAADESEASRNGSPTHKFYDDHNVEAEEHSTRGIGQPAGGPRVQRRGRAPADVLRVPASHLAAINPTVGVRRKRKLDEDHTPKLGESNGILRPVSNHVSPKINGHFRNPQEFLSMDEVLAHRLMTPYLHFVKRECPYLSKDKVRRFDPTDLSTLAYNPKRDDFEHDYRNGGELFISKIFLNGENLIFSEVELLKTAIRLAKVQRYNRILERRHCNHAIIREHQLLSEFFSIVKTYKTERGKYTIFSGESFPSRKRAEECRPYFAKMRRVLGSDELLDLAETSPSLQASGQTELNGLSPNSCLSLHRLRFVAHIAEALLLLFHFARLLSAIFSSLHAQSCLLRSLEDALPIDDEFDDGDPEAGI
ncbi:hypothetical protein M3Y99_00312600 [Aphelenchoides fujianensis]|nr:hypothetical protein M3Y99_00312600 [Aphelenchoides fujianensis]